MQLINNKVWVVFKLNMTYDDSGYDLHEKSLFHKAYFTEDAAKRELDIVKQKELDFLSTTYISGYDYVASYYPTLINQYCYIQEVQVYE
jgi:hypothetical protein